MEISFLEILLLFAILLIKKLTILPCKTIPTKISINKNAAIPTRDRVSSKDITPKARRIFSKVRKNNRKEWLDLLCKVKEIQKGR